MKKTEWICQKFFWKDFFLYRNFWKNVSKFEKEGFFLKNIWIKLMFFSSYTLWTMRLLQRSCLWMAKYFFVFLSSVKRYWEKRTLQWYYPLFRNPLISRKLASSSFLWMQKYDPIINVWHLKIRRLKKKILFINLEELCIEKRKYTKKSQR